MKNETKTETIFRHPFKPRAGAGDDTGDEFDGVCG